MSSLLGGKQINPVAVSPIAGYGLQSSLINALWNSGVQTTQGGPGGTGVASLQGLPGYQGQLSPSFSDTILPSIYGAYNPQTAGAGLYSALQPIQANAQSFMNSVPNVANSIQQTGGMGGAPTSMMNRMAQTGSPGGMNYLLPFLNKQAYNPYGGMF